MTTDDNNVGDHLRMDKTHKNPVVFVKKVTSELLVPQEQADSGRVALKSEILQESDDMDSSVSSQEIQDNVADGPLDIIELRQGLKR